MNKVEAMMILVLAGVGTGLQAQAARKPAATAAKPPAAAATAAKPAAPRSFEVISPVFHQLVAYSVPATFDLKPSDQVHGKGFLRETVLRGETPEHWTQMITLSGAQGSVTSGVTAQKMIDAMGGGYQRACPKSFAFKPIGEVKLTSGTAYLALASCGSVADEGGEAGAMHSETALLVGLPGTEDMYTLQWAERGQPSAEPLVFNDAKWQRRFQALQPVRVCDIVVGEKAPFASCLK